MSNQNTSDNFDDVLRGPTTLSGALPTAEYKTQFSIQPGNEWPERGYNAKSVWYEQNGGSITSLKAKATLAELTTDGTQTDSSVAVESPTLVYRPGSQVTVSAGVFVDVLPTGDAKYEVMFGREPRTITDALTGETYQTGIEYAGYRIVESTVSSTDRDHDLLFVVGSDDDGDGEPEENVVNITSGDWGAEDYVTKFDTAPKGEVFGKDPLDRSGPSSMEYDARKGYTYGITVGWYAPTAIVPYIVETASKGGTFKQRRHPILIYNPVESTAIQRPNQPIRVVADNGTSGQDLSARLGGRAGAYEGGSDNTPSPTSHNVYGQTVGTGDPESTTGTQGLEWYVVAVAKRTAEDPDAVVTPDDATYSVTNNAVAMVRVARESDITGTIEYDEPSNTTQGDTRVAIDAEPDTPDRLSIDTVTDPVDGETKLAGLKLNSSLLASGGNNKPGLTDTPQEFGLTIPRDLIFVYLVAARSGSSLDLDSSYTFRTIG